MGKIRGGRLWGIWGIWLELGWGRGGIRGIGVCRVRWRRGRRISGEV